MAKQIKQKNKYKSKKYTITASYPLNLYYKFLDDPSNLFDRFFRTPGIKDWIWKDSCGKYEGLLAKIDETRTNDASKKPKKRAKGYIQTNLTFEELQALRIPCSYNAKEKVETVFREFFTSHYLTQNRSANESGRVVFRLSSSLASQADWAEMEALDVASKGYGFLILVFFYLHWEFNVREYGDDGIFKLKVFISRPQRRAY